MIKFKNFIKYITEKRADDSPLAYLNHRHEPWEKIVSADLVYLDAATWKLIFAEQKNVTVAHITDRTDKTFHRLSLIQNSTKSLSTSTRVSPNLIDQGVDTTGGAVYILSGFPSASGNADLYTSMDSNGIRTVRVRRLTQFGDMAQRTLNRPLKLLTANDDDVVRKFYSLVKEPIFDDICAKFPGINKLVASFRNFNKVMYDVPRLSSLYVIMQGELGGSSKWLTHIFENDVAMFELYKQSVIDAKIIKRLIVSSYFKHIRTFLKFYMADIKDIFSFANTLSASKTKSTLHGTDKIAQNEIILTKFTIKYIIIVDDTRSFRQGMLDIKDLPDSNFPGIKRIVVKNSAAAAEMTNRLINLTNR